jgi:TRAP-type C4-dicarboxylate transport system permease small subunit
MIKVGWEFAVVLGSKGTYVSMPALSRFWMYLPVPVAGVAMIIFEVESIYKHLRKFILGGEIKA